MYNISEVFKINKKNIIISSIIVFVFIYIKFIFLVNNYSVYDKSAADLILFCISDSHLVVYLFSVIFLYLTLYLSKKDIINLYVFFRFKNRRKWYITQIFLIFLYSVISALFILFICILLSVLNFRFDINWSSYAKFISHNNGAFISEVMVNKYRPILLIFLNTLFLILYLFILGLFCFVCNLKYKKNSYGFITAFGIIVGVFNIMVSHLGINALYKIIPYRNVLISQHNLGNSRYDPTLMFSVVYFVIIITALILMGFLVLSNSDMEYGDKRL